MRAMCGLGGPGAEEIGLLGLHLVVGFDDVAGEGFAEETPAGVGQRREDDP